MSGLVEHMKDAQVFRLGMEGYSFDPRKQNLRDVLDDVEDGGLGKAMRASGIDYQLLVNDPASGELAVFVVVPSKADAAKFKLMFENYSHE